jgi:hypothetical protein
MWGLSKKGCGEHDDAVNHGIVEGFPTCSDPNIILLSGYIPLTLSHQIQVQNPPSSLYTAGLTGIPRMDCENPQYIGYSNPNNISIKE